MPVLLVPLADPSDVVLAGEQLRASIADPPPASEISNMITGGGSVFPLSTVMQDEDAYGPMNSFIDGNRLATRRSKAGDLTIRENAGIATPCGMWVWNDWPPLMQRLVFATPLWILTGTTRNRAATEVLPGCRVVVLEVGRLGTSGSPVVGETVSDGAGNYAIPVPLNTHYQVIAYLPGSPDVAGITRADVVPDPTG